MLLFYVRSTGIVSYHIFKNGMERDRLKIYAEFHFDF